VQSTERDSFELISCGIEQPVEGDGASSELQDLRERDGKPVLASSLGWLLILLMASMMLRAYMLRSVICRS
jgi:hypothetical protein